MFASLLVGLFGADPDQFLEDVAHMKVRFRGGQSGEAQVEPGIAEGFDDVEEQILLRHTRDLHVEGEPLHDVTDVLREAIDVGV